jgi:uncharacterized protein YndB with AHSA1/START domain
MTTSGNTTKRESVTIDRFYPHAPGLVWKALTTPELLERWLMKTEGFVPEVGRRFTMQGRPMPAANFSGTVACTVLEAEEQTKLSLSWDDAHAPEPTGWVVSWELQPEGRGTRVFFTHSGFDPDDPAQVTARTIMAGGWQHIFAALGRLLDGE